MFLHISCSLPSLHVLIYFRLSQPKEGYFSQKFILFSSIMWNINVFRSFFQFADNFQEASGRWSPAWSRTVSTHFTPTQTRSRCHSSHLGFLKMWVDKFERIFTSRIEKSDSSFVHGWNQTRQHILNVVLCSRIRILY